MEFKAITFEALHGECFAVDGALFFTSNGEAKNGQSTILLPKFADAPIDALIGFTEAALGGLGGDGGLEPQSKQEGKQNNTIAN